MNPSLFQVVGVFDPAVLFNARRTGQHHLLARTSWRREPFCTVGTCRGVASILFIWMLICAPVLGGQTNEAKCAAVSFHAVDIETGNPVFAMVTAAKQGVSGKIAGPPFFGFGTLWLPEPASYTLVGTSLGYLDVATSISVTNCGENARLVLEFHRAEVRIDFFVKDVRTGIPVEGAQVNMTYYGKQPPLAPVSTSTFTTDLQGRISQVLPSGFYGFLVQRGGFDDLAKSEPVELLGTYFAEVGLVSKLHSLDVNILAHDPAAAPNPADCDGTGGADNSPIEDVTGVSPGYCINLVDADAAPW